MGEQDDERERLEDELATSFREAGVDLVPDPMVLRTAELFLRGRSGRKKLGVEASAGDVWDVIDKNLDGLLAFFHVLMTRERIPMIDYGETFDGRALVSDLRDLVSEIHPAPELYRMILEQATTRVVDFHLDDLDPDVLDDISDELGVAGYEWFPAEARFEDRPARERIAGTFVVGGLVFGAYAQATGSDHLLQTKRARMFTELTVPQAREPLRGFAQEERLYERLEQLAEHDALAYADFSLPPSVLHLLVATEDIDEPQQLLERALEIRESPAGRKYREWHSAIRDAWTKGRRDPDAERLVEDISDELRHRYRLVDRPPAELVVKAGIGVNVGVAQAGIEVQKPVRLGVPDRVRNWMVETVRFRGHRKLLLRMSLEQAKFVDLASGLRRIWW